jgi:hypothetical protein
MGKDKGPFLAKGTVEGKIQLVCILEKELFLGPFMRQHSQAAFFLEPGKDFRLYPHKVTLYCRRFHFEPFNVTVIVYCFDKSLMRDPEVGTDKARFHLLHDRIVEDRHLQKVIIVEGVLVHTKLRRDQADCRKTSAFAVSPIVHLDRGREYMTSADRNTAGETCNAAAAFFSLHIGPIHQLVGLAEMVS